MNVLTTSQITSPDMVATTRRNREVAYLVRQAMNEGYRVTANGRIVRTITDHMNGTLALHVDARTTNGIYTIYSGVGKNMPRIEIVAPAPIAPVEVEVERRATSHSTCTHDKTPKARAACRAARRTAA